LEVVEKAEISKMAWFLAKMKFGLTNRISLYERMSAFLTAGIPVVDALDAIRARMEKRKDPRAKMFDQWLTVMASGSRFSDAIKEWIPTSEYMLISSGEQGGRLIDGLNEATRLSMAAAKIKKAIIAGAALPALLFFMLGGMVAGFDIYMAPVFKNLLPVNQWPENAQTLYGISHFITSYWLVILVGVGCLSAAISYTINGWVGRAREVFDRLPPWSVYKNYQASSFLIGLASMLKAGVALNDALKMMLKNGSPWLKVHINQMLATLKGGGSNSGDALDTGLFDEETAGDISDYARLSSFENAIHTIGERMVVLGVERTNQKMDVAKNLMLFLVAGTVFWIYFTSYSLQSTIAEKMQSGRR
jgi:type II secretory pathway component PulF